MKQVQWRGSNRMLCELFIDNEDVSSSLYDKLKMPILFSQPSSDHVITERSSAFYKS